jgi:hypothetical protein
MQVKSTPLTVYIKLEERIYEFTHAQISSTSISHDFRDGYVEITLTLIAPANDNPFAPPSLHPPQHRLPESKAT